jgi:2,5-furandicarboxylate decarboxylase 1
MLQMIRQSVPGVRNTHLTRGGACRYHAVVQIQKMREGEGKNAALAAFAASIDVKQVIVVDDNVNIFDPHEVEWAVATRVQADRDIFIVPRALASSLDPSAENAIGAKMGIDATVPLGTRTGSAVKPGLFERIRIPGAENIRLEDYLDDDSPTSAVRS